MKHTRTFIASLLRTPRRPVLPGIIVALLLSLGSACAITYPPASSFLYGNSSVNQVGQSSLVAGSGLPYRYLPPKNYNSAVKYPVIIFLHGQGEKGTNNTAQLAGNANGAMALVSTENPDNQTNYPCFFVAPQAPVSSGWSNVAPQLQSILNTLTQYYSIDPDRICLTGLSMGALSSWSIVADMPNTFSSLVPQSGGGGSIVSTMPKIPVWAFHAENDSTVVCNGTDNSVADFRKRGFPVIYTRYTTGSHGIWSTAYQHPQLAAWIAAQRRGESMQGFPSVTISNATLGLSPLKITGTAATNSGLNITRVGWCCSTNGGSPGAADGVTNGTTTFSSASAAFTAAGLASYRIAIRKAIASTTSSFYYDVMSVQDAQRLILDRPSTAETARSYTLYKPGGYNLLNPATGTGSADWNTWSVDVPLSSAGGGVNIAHVFAEMPSGSASLSGRTSINQPLTVTYVVPTVDTTPPAMVITNPATSSSSAFFSSMDISGVTSDNVAVTAVTWTSDRGGNGTATGTTAWNAASVPLLAGLNTITVTAKDAKGNKVSKWITVSYDPNVTALQNWKTIKFGANASNPSIAGNKMDPDHDGVENLAEYGLSGNPNVSALNMMPVITLVADRLQIAFTRLAPTDVSYIVQSSTDLVSWTSIATFASGGSAWTGLAVANETGSGSTRSVIVQDTHDISSGARRFLRLSISIP